MVTFKSGKRSLNDQTEEGILVKKACYIPMIGRQLNLNIQNGCRCEGFTQVNTQLSNNRYNNIR
jgi:hypothetical protein